MKGKNNKETSSLTTSHSVGHNDNSVNISSNLNGSHRQQLSFPDLTPIDSEKQCPRFTSILNRADGVGVGIEEMDSLQMEVERMLVNVIQRNRTLTVESIILENERNHDVSSLLVSNKT